jgi:hypothetical protein
MPQSGEPEDYILTRDHSDEASERLGDLWEIEFPECSEIQLRTSNWFRFEGSLRSVITNSAMQWLQKQAGDWIQCVKL